MLHLNKSAASHNLRDAENFDRAISARGDTLFAKQPKSGLAFHILTCLRPDMLLTSEQRMQQSAGHLKEFSRKVPNESCNIQSVDSLPQESVVGCLESTTARVKVCGNHAAMIFLNRRIER